MLFTDGGELKSRIEAKELMTDLRSENFQLHQLISRMKVMNKWKVNHLKSHLRAKVRYKISGVTTFPADAC